MPHDSAKGRTDTVSKLISASPEEIYSAFSSGETYIKWLPPPNMTGRALEYEFEPGGRYRIELRYRDGGAGKTTSDSDISRGRFVELSPGRRIRQTVEFESDVEALAGEMMMTWTFEPRQQGTEVSVTAEGVPRAIIREDHIKGLIASLENLGRFVERSTSV
jgi:uncharacterized protein YndB with AHSA1/START domain